MFATELTLSKEELQRVFIDVSRLKALYAISQLRGSQGFYEWFPKTLATVLNISAAAITLASEDRLYFDCEYGVDPDPVGKTIENSMCTFVIGRNSPLVVPDTHSSAAFRDVGAVKDGVRAYLGVPITLSDTTQLGSLCAFEFAPHTWEETDVKITQHLTEIVIAEFEKRANVFIDRANKAELNDLRHRIELGLFNLDIRAPKAEFLARLSEARHQYGF